mgnify:FL=1|jgi:hypothetical protein|tara:strand:+ start:1855 stop:2256 length:402 start_codon:yes stop_codon:yes gene_type:complete
MVNMEELVKAYLTIRNEREKLKALFEQQDEALKGDMEGLEKVMLQACSEVNADSIRTQHGTVMRSVKERFFCTDWDNFKEFVLAHGAVDLFERRIHQKNFKEFMSEHKDDGLPPGVNAMREMAITVRKATERV